MYLQFNKVAFWVKRMDISLRFRNKLMSRRIGDALGCFLEVDCDQDDFWWGENLRMKILVDISKPLRKGIWIRPSSDQESVWINVKYFCYGWKNWTRY